MPPGGITETPSDLVGGGWFIGHTEAVVTGTLAGYNAVKYARNEELLILPDTLAVGNIISYSHKQFIENRIYNERYTFAGGVFFDRMKELDLYSVNTGDIAKRVDHVKMKGIFS